MESIHHTFALSALSLTFSLASGVVPAAQAAAPQAGTQPPGFYRMKLGEFEVTALSDGTLSQPTDRVLTNISRPDLDALLARNFRSPPMETSINAFLINTGSALVLVDTGAGKGLGPNVGNRLVENLKASGYRPEQIDAVLLTHLHVDHVGGLTVDGQPVFPNALVYLNADEQGFWLDEARAAQAPADMQVRFAAARAAMAPYVAAGRVRPIRGAAQLFPGVSSRPAPGHTVGHNFYVVESQGQKLVLLGDLVHAAEVQFPRPSATILFDSDPREAAAVRTATFADAAAAGYWVAAAHISFPGVGHVRRDGDGFAWVPRPYSLGR
jgi:glyoxylase-like metal-dependent hydrolase (beta-lactamase superfamily II)